MTELARVRATIEAPASRLWPVLADFGRPQRLARTIEACTMTGAGVGAVRIVRARGRVIHERLEELDPAAGRLRYRVLGAGDMPVVGVTSYLATVTLRPVSADATEVEWSSEGEIEGSLAAIRPHFEALYAHAIANLAAEAGAPASPA